MTRCDVCVRETECVYVHIYNLQVTRCDERARASEREREREREREYVYTT